MSLHHLGFFELIPDELHLATTLTISCHKDSFSVPQMLYLWSSLPHKDILMILSSSRKKYRASNQVKLLYFFSPQTPD